MVVSEHSPGCQFVALSIFILGRFFRSTRSSLNCTKRLSSLSQSCLALCTTQMRGGEASSFLTAAIKFASTRFRASHKNADPVAGVWMERHGENELPRIIQMPRASKQVDQAAVVSLPRLHLAAMSLTKHRGSGSTPSTTIA
ncbi:uncharacterized protein LOC112351316 [Selaginella moellendorffii]|uniref:uncharacterized protein LOC112351316 n=1 Tax=Selaginella moellendorffii TaxID=88036 RepID=UPI000D1CC331|nr:uncharacterized protein LOC112351316 [Selaginella moellendorffii]|eukprot:XP_024544729.1 uncharacterized protein LOC112351316 [Selaginella moellendorffii]